MHPFCCRRSRLNWSNFVTKNRVFIACIYSFFILLNWVAVLKIYNFQDIFTAGSDTAATTINWAMAEMMKDQRVLKKAQAEVRVLLRKRGKFDETLISELKYLKGIIKEVLRMHPPGPLLVPRVCGQACEIDGYHIPIKSRVIINAWAIGRDPKYWTDPDKFYPERFIDSSLDFKGTNFEYIPFGAGRRICPGINYGMANVELTLAFLLCHFDWKLPGGMKCEDLDMTELFGASVIRKDDMYLIPTPFFPEVVLKNERFLFFSKE